MTRVSVPKWMPSRYKFTGPILNGGQGYVFICEDTTLGRPVAVKAFNNISDLKALDNEIRGRAKIRSKHFAELYECVHDGKVPVGLVMEYVGGHSLGEPDALPKELDGKFRLLFQLACGIADIHDAGVIHRDIKPANMKIDQAGILKIFDLGIANLDATAASTVGGAGTYCFVAPELYEAPIRVSTAADIYALGVMGWMLLGNALPPALLQVPPQSGPPPLPLLECALPGLPHITRLFDRALSLDPIQRPAAHEIRDAVAKHMVHASRRGLFATASGVHALEAMGTVVKVESRPHLIRVAYAEGRFVLREVVGYVFINNVAAAVGMELPSSCVITFGVEGQGRRVFMPFDVSQPEIVL